MLDEQIKTQIETLLNRAISNQSLSRPQQAIVAYNEAVKLAASVGWNEKQIEILYSLGLLLQDLGVKANEPTQVQEAITVWEEALSIAKRTGDNVSIGTLHLMLGFACAWATINIEAINYLSKAATALEGIDFETAFSALNTLGVLLSNQNQADDAIPYYQQALQLARQNKELPAEADVLANLSVAYEKGRRLPEAITTLEAYHKILFEEGDVKAQQTAIMVKRLKDKYKAETKRK